MTHNQFDYKELLTFGWQKTKQHFWFLLGILGISILLSLLVEKLPLVSDIVSMLISIATISVLLRIVEGHTPHYKDLLRPFKNYKITWHFFLGMLLIMAVVFIISGSAFLLYLLGGTIGAVIGGAIALGILIYYGLRIQFFRYIIVEDENVGPITALKKSMEMTEHKFVGIFWFTLIIIGINLLGLLALIVGLLVTVPVSLIAYTYLYKKLSTPPSPHKHHDHVPAGAHIAAA